MTEEHLIKQFQQIEDNFNVAVISNSVDEIKRCITSDWVLIDSQGGIIPQEGFFKVLEQGLLSHSTLCYGQITERNIVESIWSKY
jgi:hypothetical protein